MQKNCLIQLEIKELLSLCTSFCDFNIKVTLGATLDDTLIFILI